MASKTASIMFTLCTAYHISASLCLASKGESNGVRRRDNPKHTQKLRYVEGDGLQEASIGILLALGNVDVGSTHQLPR